MLMTAKRRCTSINVVAAKCAKLSEDWQSLVAKKAETEVDLDIALIVHELQQNPDKVKACKMAVMGSAFSNSDTREADFPLTYVYLPKVARSFLEPWFEKLDGRLSAMTRKGLIKVDKLIFHKLLYRICLCDKSSCIPHHNKAKFKEYMESRMDQCGSKLTDVIWNADFEVQWSRCGVYKLLPEIPEGHKGQHAYTSISFNGKLEVKFQQGISVSAEWCIDYNWPMKGAILQSPKQQGSKMSIRIPCKDMFESKPVFQTLISGAKLSQSPVDADGELIDGVKALVEHSAESQAGKFAITPPKGARKALTASQRQALVGLRAMA